MLVFLLNILFAFSYLNTCGNCLRPVAQHRILGGIPAVDISTNNGLVTMLNREEYPYIAEIEYFDEHWCGGTLISNNAVLTAAHCLEDRYCEYFKIRVGGTFLKDTGSLSDAVQWSIAQKYLIHPEHRSGATSNNDIGIIWTTDHFNLSSTVGIIQLAWPGLNLKMYETEFLGWGYTENGELSNILLKATTKFVSHEKCRSIFGQDDDGEIITNNMICVQDDKKSTICTADSGGPLVLHYPNMPKLDILIGLASFGKDKNDGSCDESFPSVFVKVATFFEWVKKNLNDGNNSIANE